MTPQARGPPFFFFDLAQLCTVLRTVEVSVFITVDAMSCTRFLELQQHSVRPRSPFPHLLFCALPMGVGGGSIPNKVPVGDRHRRLRATHPREGVDRPAAGH